jgi:hypothetical protein
MMRGGVSKQFWPYVTLLITFILVCHIAKAATSPNDVASKEERLLVLIDKEIQTVANVKKRGEQLDYRLFELYSEKTKIMRRNEHRLLLKDPKKKDFSKSEAWYVKAQALGQDLIKRYPAGRFISEIYYSLAGNMIEVRNQIEADGKQLEVWLLQSIKHSRNGEEKYAAQVKMAEVYYSLKRFDDAIKFYKEIVRNTQDPWYPKNLYNYAWCVFQKKEYKFAVDIGLKAYFVSRSGRHQDYSDQIKVALNHFFVFDKRPMDAIKFHIKESKGAEKADHLMKVVRLAQKFVSSQAALDSEALARNHCEAIKNIECLIPLSEFKLGVKRESKDYAGHYQTFVTAIREYKLLTPEQRAGHQELFNLMINNVAEVTSYLQGAAYKNHYIINQDSEKTYARIINYYNGLKIMNPSFRYEYEYLQAELSYKELKFKESSKYYLASLNEIPKEDSKLSEAHKTFLPKLFKSMIAYSNDERTKDDDFFEKTHLAYLHYYPKESHSIAIYKAAFKFYQVKKDNVKSESMMLTYIKQMPSELNDHREMFKVVLNNHTESKNIERLTYWVGQMQAKFLDMGEEFIKLNVSNLAQILFEQSKKLEDKGQYELAIAEYQKIIDHPLYPATIKNDCYYNISVNFMKLERPLDSVSWMQKALPRQSKESLTLKMESILSMIQYYLLFQEYRGAKWAYEFIMPTHCDLLKNKDQHFYQLQHITLMQHDLVSVQKNYSKIVTKCAISSGIVAQVKRDFIDYLFQHKHFEVVMKLMDNPANGYQELADFTFANFETGWWNIPLNQKDQQDQYFAAMKKFFTMKSLIGKFSEENQKIFAQMEVLQEFYREGLKLNLSLPVMTPFKLEVLTEDVQKKLTALIAYKDKGLDLAKSAANSNLYSSTLAMMFYNYTRGINALEKYPLSNVPESYRQDLGNNLKELATGMRSQRADFYSAYEKLNAKSPMINNFIRFFNHDDQDSSWINNVVSSPLKLYLMTKENS